MDHFSITCGIAGIAGAAATLAKGLYDIITSVHDAPEETAAILESLSDVSLLLDQVRHVLKGRQGRVRYKLLRGIKSSSQRIMRNVDRMCELATLDNRTDRIWWALRGKEADRLLERIRHDKDTLCQIISMEAENTDRGSRASRHELTPNCDERRSNGDGEAFRRGQVYILINSASNSILDVLLPQSRARDFGISGASTSSLGYPLHAEAAASDIKQDNTATGEQLHSERPSPSSGHNFQSPRLYLMFDDLEADLGSLGSKRSTQILLLAEALSKSLQGWSIVNSSKAEEFERAIVADKKSGLGLVTKAVVESNSRPPVATPVAPPLASTQTPVGHAQKPDSATSSQKKPYSKHLFGDYVQSVERVVFEPRRNVAFQIKELKERLKESKHHGSKTNQLNLRKKIEMLETELKENAIGGKAG